jgi:excisionase family DNA binding protein
MSRPTRPPDAPPEAAPPDRLWSIDDLAAYLNVSRRAVERLKSAGRLPRPVVIGRRCPRWSPEAIREWIERGGR